MIVVVRAGSRLYIVGMTGNKGGGVVGVSESLHNRLRVRSRKLNHKEFLDDSVDKEVVLLIAFADRHTRLAVVGKRDVYLDRLTALRHHSRMFGVVRTFVLTDEDIVEFVALAVYKESAEAVVATTGDLVLISAVCIFRDFGVELGNTDKDISELVRNLLHLTPRKTSIEVALNFARSDSVAESYGCVRSG